MKKEFVTGHGALRIVMALLMLALLWQATQKAQAAADYRVSENDSREIVRIPEKRLMKTIPLDADTVTQIPRYIVEDDTAYVLDEASIVVEETGRSSSEGADVVTTSRKVEKLPDNDLERIDKKITWEGIDCDLLSVLYEVTQEDEDGIPVQYSAACEYGGLKKYSRSYPSAWQATLWYDAYEVTEEPEIVTEYEISEYTGVPSVKHTKVVKGKSREEPQKEPFPKPEIKRFRLKRIVPGAEEEEEEITEFPILPLAAALGTGALLPFLIWFSLLTAPVFTPGKRKKDRYIGRVRLKKEEGTYAAYLTGRLIARADIPVFKIKVPERVRKKAKADVLQINCPDGRRITAICGKEVRFTLERE